MRKRVHSSIPHEEGRFLLNKKRLKALRRRQGLSQTDLAQLCVERKLPLSIASIKRAEAGRFVGSRTARALCEFFHIELDYLLQDSHLEDRRAPAGKDIPNDNKVVFLLIDDHTMFREGLIHVLHKLNPSYAILEAGSLKEAISILNSDENIDLILLDLKLPDASSLDGFHKLRKLFPLLPIALISAENSKKTMVKALQCGAQGFIHKSTSSEILHHILELMISGGVYVPRSAIGST